MQTLDSFYETAMRRGHHIVGKPIVIAEWNFNNIFEPEVSNLPEGEEWAYGDKYFPVKSITNSIRPVSSGIFAAFTDDAMTYSDNSIGLESERYYTVGSDPEIVYSYWICPTPSGIVQAGASETGEYDPLLPDYYAVERGTVLVEYPAYVNMNKIKVLFNLGTTPGDWSIFLHTEGVGGDGYVEIENPTIDPITGRVEIWFDGADWVETQQLDESIYSPVDKIKVEVRAVDEPNARLQIVEIAGAREIALSPRVQDYSVNIQMDDVDFIHPVGRMCASDGSIAFNNTDLKIREQDETSDFYGLLSGRCQYRLYVRYDLTDQGGSEPEMRVGTLYANDWQQVNEYEYEVELWDIIKLLQTTKAPSALFENVSIALVFSQILDSIGVDTYELNFEDFDSTSIVKYLWVSGEETVYDVLDKLCQSYQAAIYADEFGVLQLLTRSNIANEEDEPVWTFRGEQVGLDIADIETLSKKYNLQANEVTIKYKQMEAPSDPIDLTDQPLTSKVWESSDTIVVRASPMVRVMSGDGLDHHPTSNKDVWVNATAVQTWPYKGRVSIDGEIIEYDGKGYTYWDYSTNPPTSAEKVVHSDEERRDTDKTTWLTYDPDGAGDGPAGGTSTDPTKQNKFTGRLWVTKRDSDDAGRMKEHSNYWDYGWMGMKAWVGAPGNSNFPTRYVEPGGSTYNMANLQNHKTRPGWNTNQTRWSVQDSYVRCNNTADGNGNAQVLIRDVGDTEYREIGTRMRVSGANACGGLIFYLSNASGYDNTNPTLTDPLLATRYYMLTLTATEVVERYGRSVNEITLEVKNGNTQTRLKGMKFSGPDDSNHGKVQIEKDKWYDVDVVVKDGAGIIDETGSRATQIEVYLDGRWMETFHTFDNIRPTGLMGVHARQPSIVDFDYFYGTSTSLNARPGYTNNDLFETHVTNLPSGTSKRAAINLATASRWSLPGSTMGSQSVITFTSLAQANITSLKIRGGSGNNMTSTELGPIVVQPNTRVVIDVDSAIAGATAVELLYTSTQELSVCWEYTNVRNFPYGTETWVTPPDNSFYDYVKGGWLGSKHDYFVFDNPLYPNYTEGDFELTFGRSVFTDDFGAMVREIRDFDVEYDVSPAKGVRVYISNPQVRVTDHQYNPVRGIFSLVNTSGRDQIVNGTEEIDDANSIDHSLMLYGYILEDKGDKTKVVKDTGSIRRYGPVAIDLEADWVFNEEEAETLGDWIVEHWSEPMDTVNLTVYSNTFSQIGDKVNIVYSNANIESDWLYIVSDKTTTFDDDGLDTSLTLRRVR